MAELTRDSSIQELANEYSGRFSVKLFGVLNSNQEHLAKRNIHSLGDLLTREGERELYSLGGIGEKTMAALHSFLSEKGFTPDWPPYSRAVNFAGVVEDADMHYAAKTGEPVGEFSRKIKENTEALRTGARLKGRRTL